MTRTISTFIAQGYMIEKGKENPALDAAQKLTLDEIELDLLGAAAEAPKENAAGSYETLSALMGSGGRPTPRPM